MEQRIRPKAMDEAAGANEVPLASAVFRRLVIGETRQRRLRHEVGRVWAGTKGASRCL